MGMEIFIRYFITNESNILKINNDYALRLLIFLKRYKTGEINIKCITNGKYYDLINDNERIVGN